uniref:Uncharacterized protein n=1 Tax=Eiseniibacteriota bacterium TaxID=2212470 RepID=A0A832I4C6_UNCEI
MKKTIVAVLALVASAGLAAVTAAGPGHDHDHKSAAVTVTGEVVDLGCYLGHAAVGEKHASCATKCIAGGMPMGLLTADGKLYLLTMNHDNADPYQQLKSLAAKKVTVTGMLMERSGMKGLDVTAVKAPAAAAGK